jgi:hypothetical protein
MTAEKSAEEVRIEVQRHLRFTIFSGLYDHIGQQARSLGYNSAEAFVAHYRDETGEEPVFGGTDDSGNGKVTLDELKRLIAFYAPRAEIYVVLGRDEVSGGERFVRGEDGEPLSGTLDEVRAFYLKYFSDIASEPRTYAVIARRTSEEGSEEVELGRGSR